MAKLPDEQLEAALAEPEMPNSAAIVRLAEGLDQPIDKRVVQVSNEALWIWGRLRDIERAKYLLQRPVVGSSLRRL